MFRHIQPLSSFLTSPCHLLYNKCRSLLLPLSLPLVHFSIFSQKNLSSCPCPSPDTTVPHIQLPLVLYFSTQRGLHIKMAAEHCTNTNAAQGWWRLCWFTTCLLPSPAASLILSITLLFSLAPKLPSTSCDGASHPLTQIKPNCNTSDHCQSLYSVLICMTCLCYSLPASLPDSSSF